MSDDSPNSIEDAGKLLKSVPTIISSIVALSGLAYVAGYLKSTAYFNELGAVWIAHMRSTTDFLQSGALQVIIMALFAVMGISLVERKFFTVKTLMAIEIVIAFTAVVASIVSFIYLHFRPNVELGGTLGLVIGTWIAVAAGIGLGFMILTLAENGYRWSSRDLYVAYVVVSAGIIFSPIIKVIGHAKRDCDPNYSTLPRVTIDNDSSSWRLAAYVTDKFVLINVSNPNANHFKVVDSIDVQSIEGKRY